MNMILITILLLFLMIIKVPVAFAMASTASLALFLTGIPLDLIPQRLFGSLNTFSLLSIPLFIFVGEAMNAAGVTDRIFNFAKAFVGHIKGGLGHVNVISSMIFAGMSGSAVADAYGLGLIEIKAMKESGFDADFSAAVTAASSTIGPIIPPSIPLVIYAFVAEESIGKLFLGGVFPGLMMGISLMIMVYFISKQRGYKVENRANWQQRLKMTIKAIPSLLTPVLLFSGIGLGIVTPTEGAIIAGIYAVLLGVFLHKDIDIKKLYDVFYRTVINSATILIIIACASTLSWIIISSDFPEIVKNNLVFISGNNVYVLYLFINIALLILGCFLEGTAIIMIMLSVLLPTLREMNIDLVHFGVVMVLNIMIGAITPPVGLCLYIVTEISQVPFKKVVKATIPFIVPLIIVLLLITYFPPFVTFLPNLIYGY